MKPTKLIIKGLNSFSDEQIIDFNVLSEQGIFGIFGPTGSGKSTVLDAITFALYGRIARESGAKTSSDVININEKTAKVVFEFDVNGKEHHSYKIIREIKRKEPSGILTTQVKIYETSTGEETILAEKDKEFNAVIANIIGLEYDDFVKTVVLPQGGFNDFLKMEGKDRRVVLERLFNLEKYGEDLFRKISSKYGDKNSEKIALEGELKAYEDLSEESLKLQKEETLALEKKQAELREKKNKDNEATEKAKRQFELQKELEQRQKELKNEQAKTPLFEEIRIQIKNNQKYQIVESQITEYKKLVKDGKSTAIELKKLEEQAEGLQDQKKKVEERFGKLEDEKNNKYPELLKKQSQLETSIEGYNSYRKNLKDQELLEKRTQTIAKQKQENDVMLAKLSEKKVKQTEEMNQLKNQLDELKNGESHKENLNKAIAIIGKIDALKDHRSNLENQAQSMDFICDQIVAAESSDSKLFEAKIIDSKDEITSVEIALQKMKIELEALSTDESSDPKEIMEKLAQTDKLAEVLNKNIKNQEQEISKNDLQIEKIKTQITEIKIEQTKAETENEQLSKILAQEKEKIEKLLGQMIDPSQELEKVGRQVKSILKEHEEIKEEKTKLEERLQKYQTEIKVLENNRNNLRSKVLEIQTTLYEKLEEMDILKFSQINQPERNRYLQEYIPVLEAWHLTKSDIEEKEGQIQAHHKMIDETNGKISDLRVKVGDQILAQSEYEAILQNNKNINTDFENATNQLLTEKARYENNQKRFEKVKDLTKEANKLAKELSILNELRTLLSGRKFVEFMAINQLKYVTLEATKMLGDITSGGYSLEVDEFGTFKIRDNKNGGMLRNVKSLSGGETFLVSLSLALALSSQIQLKGVAPLELFFLDEGFGTLDDDLLDTVMEALEAVKHDKLKIGLISHVEQLKQRIPVRLSVTPAKSGMGGSKVKIEYN